MKKETKENIKKYYINQINYLMKNKRDMNGSMIILSNYIDNIKIICKNETEFVEVVNQIEDKDTLVKFLILKMIVGVEEC